MPRYAAILEYDGSAFAGWQKQGHALGVQAVVEAALSKVADAPVETICAGRTDAGVHATHQLVHFDVVKPRLAKAWVWGSNAHLPDTVAVRWAGQVAAHFNARFSALARRYRYVLRVTPARSGVFSRNLTTVQPPLNVTRMQCAAQHFLGEQDFSSVRAAECSSATPVRNIHRLDVYRHGEFVIVDISANAFLHHMVRNIVGVLLAVGRGERATGWVRELLQARDRRLAPQTAPAAGLYLVGVKYPARFCLPVLSPGPLFLPDHPPLITR